MTGFDYNGFVHLRVRSAFSLAEGALPAKELVKLAGEAGMPAVAITDNNNLFGAFEFSQKAKGAGLQPILGAILTIDLPVRATDEKMTDELVLLCQSEAGYQSLSRLVSKAHLETPDAGFPKVPLSEVIADNAGLIALWGGSASALVKLQAEKDPPIALETLVDKYKAAFGNRLYLELQRCGEAWEARAEPKILQIADAHDLPLVATNDVYFGTPDRHEAHDVLLCIGGGRYEAEKNRRRVTAEHSLKPPEAMKALFADIPEAIENTVEIARRTAFLVAKRKPLLPVFPLPEGESADSMLDAQAREGFEERFASVVARLGEEKAAALRPRYLDRLKYELDIIKRMEFSGYFLIVSDFMKWSKRSGIPVGVRGSGATSIVAWCIYITHLDPIRFDLVFERFLNPERISMPDFDIDFCQERRGEVIDYVAKKYGAESVAQIITFGKLQAKAAVRDVGRVLGAPFSLVERLSKLIGDAPSIDEARKSEPGIDRLAEDEPLAARCLDIGRKIEGLYRHASTHAAGVVISDRQLVDLVPLYKDPKSDMPVTQFHFKDAEAAGLVKFDFLGLRTLTIIAKTVELAEANRGIKIDVDALDFGDSGVYEMLRSGDVSGVFQLESAGMRDLLRRMRPDHFEQLIALISLYRPGPMDSIPSYIARANGVETIEYDHPMLEPVLSETYGIITYQEDVMQIARDLAGYSLGDADLLRRAMGKKIKAEMAVHGERFRTGAAEHGIDQATADLIFEKCAKFAGYGFNKGHAAAYAQVSYQTAYLKHHYPLEFYAACMSVDMERIDRLATYCAELRRRGTPVLPPDINASQAEFSIEKTPDGDRIRYGLGALKGVGTGISGQIADERRRGGPFKDLYEFSTRCAPFALSRSVVDQFARAGAFDRLEANRAAILEGASDLIRHGVESWKEATSAQSGLFGAAMAPRADAIKKRDRRSRLEDLKDEVAAIGFFVSGHPLDDIFVSLKAGGATSIEDFLARVERTHSAIAKLACIVHSVQIRRAKNSGNKYAFVSLSDPTGETEVMVFSELLANEADLLKAGEQVLATVQGKSENDSIRLTLLDIDPLKDSLGPIKGLEIALQDDGGRLGTVLDSLNSRLTAMEKGASEIHLQIALRDPGRMVKIALPGAYAIDTGFIQEASALWGNCHVLQ